MFVRPQLITKHLMQYIYKIFYSNIILFIFRLYYKRRITKLPVKALSDLMASKRFEYFWANLSRIQAAGMALLSAKKDMQILSLLPIINPLSYYTIADECVQFKMIAHILELLLIHVLGNFLDGGVNGLF